MLTIDESPLFSEVTNHESASISGGIRRARNCNAHNNSISIEVNLAQMIFAFGAYHFTLMLTGNAELAQSVLTNQWNRAFRSFF